MADLLYYGTEDAFETYCAERGYTIPAGDVETALTRASMFIDANFKFMGQKTGGRDQQRAWPRDGAQDAEGYGYNGDEVPWQIEHATYEAALRELTTPGSLLPDVTPGKLKTAVTVGSVSVTYNNGGVQGEKPVLTVLGGILASLLGSTSPSPMFGSSGRS